MAAPFPIEVGHKFASIHAMTRLSRLQEDVRLDVGTTISTSRRPLLGGAWRTWLGTLDAEEAARCNFSLFVSKPTVTPGVLNAENEQLKIAASLLLNASVVAGFDVVGRAFMLTGEMLDNGIDVRSVVRLEDFVFRNLHHRVVITPDNVAQIHEISLKVTRLMQRQNDFLRFSRGFRAVMRAFQFEDAFDRIHQFVRALDALILGRGRQDFAKRMPTLVGGHNADFFRRMYMARSCVEHLNPFDSFRLPANETNQECTARLDGYAESLEVFAPEVYRRIILSDAVVDEFADDARAQQFWNSSDDERLALFGEPVNAEAIMNDRRLAVDRFHLGY